MGRGKSSKRKIVAAPDPAAKRPHETHFQWRARLARLAQEKRDKSEPLVPAEAVQHGNYRDANVLHVETFTIACTKRNRGGTPVMRWLAAKKLSETQMLAIMLCYRLWDLCGIKQRVTGTYGERLAVSEAHIDHRAVTTLEATEDLYRIQSYIPTPYWEVFQNVCRFDEPAGVAGHAAGYSSRTAERRAHAIVCFVADTIAQNERLLPEIGIQVAA